MDPPASPEEGNGAPGENTAEGNNGGGGRRSSGNGRRISQLLDRINGRRASQDGPQGNANNDINNARNGETTNGGGGGVSSAEGNGSSRRPSQEANVGNGRRNSDASPRPDEQAAGARRTSQVESHTEQTNGSRRNSGLEAGLNVPGSRRNSNVEARVADEAEGNSIQSGTNGVAEQTLGNDQTGGGESSRPTEQSNGTRRISNVSSDLPEPANGSRRNSEDIRTQASSGGDQDGGSRRNSDAGTNGVRNSLSVEGGESVTSAHEASETSAADSGRRPSLQARNGRRASQELDEKARDDISQAAAMITDLINRVSIASEAGDLKVPGPAAVERRESLRRASITLDKTSSRPAKDSAGPSSPVKERKLSGEYPGRSERRKSGGTRELSRDSSDVDSTVDDIEAEYVKDVMKKRRSMQENQTRETMEQRAMSPPPLSDFHARLLALRLAVQDYELPMQLAYDELDELAANAERVKTAIEKNMTLLTIQMRRSSIRYMRSAFTALKFYYQRRKGKRLAMKNANEYFQRRMFARAFQAWRIFFLSMQKFKRLQQSAEKFLRRHNLARIWRAWASLVKKRIREDERHRREKQLVRELQIKQRECVARRAVNAIRRRRFQRAFFAFKVGVEISREIQERRDHIFYLLIRRKAALAFKFWKKFPTNRARDMRAILRRERKILLKCFWHWDNETCYSKYRKRRMARCRLANAFRLWIFFVCQKARYDTIVIRVTRSRLRRQFHDLREICLEQKWKKRTCKRVQKKCEMIRMRWTFQAWICYMQSQAHKRMIKIEEYVAILEKENQRTRTECDRLARIVETGEWDQQRVLELEQASQVLSGERDALTKLVGRLEREHAYAMEYQRRQEQEIKLLKDQMLGSNFIHRNKLLVRGASSFNSVVRAVKSEVLKRGVNPEVVYSIDKMAMDQVSVFPDGDVRVKPLNKFDKGKWMHRASTDATKAFMEDPKVPLVTLDSSV